MPLVPAVRGRFPPLVWGQLNKMGVQMIDQPDAQLRIGLLNLMPSATRDKTIEQFFGLCGSNPVRVSPVLIRFDDYVPKSGRDAMLAYYEPFSEVCKKGLDGLIVTGANLELTDDGSSILPVSEIFFHKEWCHVLEWASTHVRSTIFSCLGAHVALEYFYGATRNPLGNTTFNNTSGTVGQKRKTFGVFTHKVDHAIHPALTRGLNDRLRAPHSRWGDVPIEEITRTAKNELQIVAASEQSGWQMLVGRDARQVFLQGHPEYYTWDLGIEYCRDKDAGMVPHLPVGYFPDNDDTRAPVNTWRADAHILYRNWVELLLACKASSPGLAKSCGATPRKSKL